MGPPRSGPAVCGLEAYEGMEPESSLLREEFISKKFGEGGQLTMATTMCEVCGVRPASVALRRIVPGEEPRIEYLCGMHAAEVRVERT